MTSQRKLRHGDLVVCVDGGGYPLLSEGIWSVAALLDDESEYPVILTLAAPRPPVGCVEVRQTNVYRVTLLDEVLPDLRLAYEQ